LLALEGGKDWVRRIARQEHAAQEQRR
jgi:hypothetical protein